MAPKRLISVVVPVYNEQDNIPVFYEVASKELGALSRFYNYELIFVDDGSVDCSWKLLEKLALCDEHVKAISFSRNFGHQAALMAGYELARGDAVVSIDADMQHPPELIVDMIKKWRSGADVVYARKVNRKDNFFKKICSLIFYQFLDMISDIKIPRNVSDFRLIDKKVLTVICDCQEKSPYLRGLVAWTGFKHDFIECQYFKRFSGTTSYTWKKMFSLAWDGVTGFSLFPLRISAYIGFLILFFGIGLAGYLLVSSFIWGVQFGVVTWLIEVVLFIVASQFLVIWLLGEYIGKIHAQEKGRPLYVVAKKIEGARPHKTVQFNVEKKGARERQGGV